MGLGTLGDEQWTVEMMEEAGFEPVQVHHIEEEIVWFSGLCQDQPPPDLGQLFGVARHESFRRERFGYAARVEADAQTEGRTATEGRSYRNDPCLYDRFRDDWWSPRGRFAALHWLSHSRAELIPPPRSGDELLVDIGCGAGLLAPHVRGFRHVGIDLSDSALRSARTHGVETVKADAGLLPIADRSASVVVAGEIFEHLEDLDGCLDEIARVMKPGSTLVFDTINDTRLARLVLIHLGERLPGGPPSELHDPALFVAPVELERKLEARGIAVEWWGLRPSIPGYVGYLLGRESPVEMVRSRLEAVLYQGMGRRR